MATPRALIVVLLLGLAVPIGLAGLAQPVYAQEDGGDSQGDDGGDQTGSDEPAQPPGSNEGALVCVEGQACPEGCEIGKPCPQLGPDFNKLDVGGANAAQNTHSNHKGTGNMIGGAFR